jgi:hypothetical protein
VNAALDGLKLPASDRASIDRELPKLAGADVDAVIGDEHRAGVRRAIDDSFAASFQLIMNVAGGIALVAAVAGAFHPGAASPPNW